MRDITISNIQIGASYKPMVIAEMSGNHNGSLERALDIVDMAAKAGAQALKIQTYTADTMTIPKIRGFSILMTKILFGMESRFTTYIKPLSPLGNGTKPFLTAPKATV